MDEGLEYTYYYTTFPRYHYFHTRLNRLLPRLHNILEVGDLPDCVSQGRKKLKKISFAARNVTDRVTVNLFAQPDLSKEQKIDLLEKNISSSNLKVEQLKWTGYKEDLLETSSFQPIVTIIVSQSEEKVSKECNKLTEELQEGVVLFDNSTKMAVLYTDLSQTSGHSEAIKRSLVQQVQYVLERKVMTVLEMIAGYIEEFIPRREQEVDNSLLDAIHLMLINSLKDPFVVKDLSPSSEAILWEKVPTDHEIDDISPYIAREFERVAEILGISTVDIDRIKMDNKTTYDRCSKVLQRWREKQRKNATMNNLLKLLKETKVNIEGLESTFLALGSEEEKDKIFQKKLTDFVINKTKCVVCDTLTRKYGISASLINEFLNEGFYDYKAKLLELLGTIEMPSWPRDRTDDGVSTCRVFSYRFAMNMTKLIHNTEDYIKSKHNILIVLKKLQFELQGYLLQAKVEITTPMQDIPKLPMELQYDLLSIEEITGCGTCYGELVLHVNKTLYPAKKEEIKQILQEHKYMEGYKCVMMSEKTAQGRALQRYELGQELRARKVRELEGFNFGSLGCFFNLRPKRLEEGVSQQNPGAMVSSAYEITEAKDHCLTCAHCLKDCQNNVEARINGFHPVPQYHHFGIKKCYIYEPEAIDVASVEVADEILERCDFRLKNSHLMYVPTWQVFNVDPLRRDVHKEGCSSSFTRGLVMSTNYMTKRIKEYNALRFRETGNLEPGFKISYNILIESLPGAGAPIRHISTGEIVEPFEVHPFSQEGDSGSVVIADDADNPQSVNAVALLLGAVSENNRFRHSYASLMERTIEEVETQFDCLATPSTLYPREIERDIDFA